MRYLDVPYFKQDTGYTCGPTSLQMVLAYYGVHESEAGLAEELETNKIDGTYHHNLIDAVVRRGLYCYVNDRSSLNEITYLLKDSIPLIVHFLETDEHDDHYSVIVGLTDTEVVLNDPWSGERVHMPRSVFAKRWTCADLGNCKEWLLAVSSDAFRLGRQYHPRKT